METEAGLPASVKGTDPPDWSDEQWDAVLDKWADKLAHHNMELAALVVGEAQKPLSFAFGQAVYFFEPFLDAASFLHPVLRGEQVEVLGALLSDRRRLEKLLKKLEKRAERKPGGRNHRRGV